jgi:hypothetical protein
MIKKIIDALSKEFAENASQFLWAFLAPAAVGGVYFWDRFYHPGWIKSYAHWLPFVAIIWAIAIILCFFPRWLLAIGGLALVGAAGFGYLYGNAEFESGGWPLFTWLLHMILVGLVTAFAIGGIVWLQKQLRRRKRGPR